MATLQQETVLCQICHEQREPSEVLPADMVREPVAELIRRKHPDWSSHSYICFPDLHRFRMEYVEHVLAQEKGELSALEQEVLQSIGEHKLLSENLNIQFDQRRTWGQRLSEKIADFIGSWGFLLCFVTFFLLWMSVNGAEILWHRFDTKPQFDFLKLTLAIFAVMQLPIILMSQNRQKAKDRLRAEHDYLVSLKAELEVRHLNAKMDMFLNQWWQRIVHIQQIQMELMDPLVRSSSRDKSG